MSEVQRYLVDSIRLDNPSTARAVYVVGIADFDAQRLRADTAEAELERAECMRENYKIDAGIYRDKLAAAEQRIASHESTLRHFASCADVRQVGTAAMDYVAALNPNPEAESHE